MGVAEQNIFENESFLEMIYSSISGYVVLVGAVLIVFILSLFIPRGIKRELLNSERRRYAHSQFYIGELMEQTNLVKSFNRLKYESLTNIDTSQLYANQADNDDLSPLERVEQGMGYQSIFRVRPKSVEERKEMRKIEANLSSLMDREVSPSTRASESTSGTHSSSGLFSLSSQEWQNVQLCTPENKENLLPIDKPPLGRSTPKTPKVYTESPLSVVTDGFRNGGFIILSNGDKDQNILNYLNENRVKYRIVNALDPKHKKRSNKLSAISGITGLYPQIFFIDASKTPIYIGSRESILALQKNQKLSIESLQAFAKGHECDQILTEISNADLDTSYFSV